MGVAGGARLALGVLVGAVVEAVLGLPLSPVLASPFAGAAAGLVAGPPPHRGMVAGFLGSLFGVAALAVGLVELGYRALGLPGALLASAPASGLLLVGAFSSLFAAGAGAAVAGLRGLRR